MVKSHLVVIVLVLALTFPIATPLNVNADDAPTGFRFCTIMPAANNSTQQTVYPRFATPVTSCSYIEAAGDSSVKTLSSELLYHFTTNDFLYVPPTRGNPLLYQSSFPDVGGLVTEYYPIFAMPGQNIPDNPDWEANTSDATILRVYMYAIFSGSLTPGGYLAFSNDSGSSWTYASYHAASGGMFYQNITTWETWTPALCRDSGLSVKLDAWPSVGYSYDLDYLGLVIYWQVPDPNPQPSWDSAEAIGPLGIIGMFGLMGLIGMIGVPPATVLALRMSDEPRMTVFIKMLALFMICATLFMMSILS